MADEPIRGNVAIEAAKELLARRQSREHLDAFAKRIYPTYEVAAHHKAIIERLEAVERGDIRRLMVFTPPRSGKSMLISKLFPAWYLGRNPEKQFIAASYSADLAHGFGRDVRNIIGSEAFTTVFPGVSLAEDSKSRSIFHLPQGGVYVAAGVGGGLTGRGSHCVVGDTKVITREGQLCIKELCQCNPIPDVLSYDHAQGKTRWGKVTAYKISQAKNILKVQAEGRTLKCTKEHLIYTDEGYKPAHTVHDKKVFCLGQGNVFGTQAIVTAAMEPNDVECAVYDIQVEVTHNFFADGILVHNCAIIDDPLRSREDADSPLVREAVWDWYSSVLYTRRMPNAALVLVMTRWHQLDLAGRLLEAQDNGGDKWEILELPAIKNEGTDYEEALWPSWYPLEELKRTRSVLVPRDWQALYQQKPTTDEGAFFKKAWFKRHSPNVHTNAKHMHTYIGTDFAVTDSNGDYTELLVFAQGEDNVSYLIDGYSGQSTANVWIDKLLDFVVAYKPLAVFGESGVIRRAIEPFLIKRMRERNTFARMVWVASITDKATRARAFQARAAMGNVSLPNTHFGERVLGQLTGFPGTKYDDAVDACGVFARGLEDVHAHLVTSSPSQTRRSLREVQREAEGVDFWRIV